MPLMTAADFCDRHAREIGHQEALVDRWRRLSWSQVKDLSDRLALRLLALGLQRDDRVLVQLPNGAELFLARLACEKAGLRLLTVTPTFRRAELAPIVQFTKPAAAIIPREYRGFNHHELLESIRTPELKHLLVAGEYVPPGTLSMEEIFSAPTEKNGGVERLQKTRYTVLAVCQAATTSGSTGTPKCVEVPLYTRLLTGCIHLRRFRLNSGDTLAAVTSIVSGSADALAYNGGCQSGARVVLLDHFTPEETCAVLERERVNAIPLVPTMMARLMAIPNLSRYDLRSLRVVVSHGSILPYALGAEFEERMGCRITQGYGSVDCGGICANSWDDPPEVRLGTVGRPLDGNEVRIVDEEGRDVSPGEVGRLLVHGPHADAHFFNNPDLNARSRREGYFDLQELGRLDGMGNVILMGREKDLIIRGGQNIFPSDVEGLLTQHPKALEVSVVGIPDEEMGERVCAVVVCREGQSLSLAEVRSFLEEKGAARFKWPERIVLVDSLPKVAAGHKIDKKKLKEDLRRTV
ncbi:MAG: acyl--CoA ligase [Candidatus Tectomicrobia bacterium]|uniref:Acyl--CoA ligase n=1 Tax=Tectimicrobiota bacterium TaxID=2528274 RepID=A0A932GRW2_UNCTE|nr:acyl--CoA ligase [Candidatus Tectomicrobia bacterium]